MPASPGKQKRLDKQKKKRAMVRKRDQTRKAALFLPRSDHGLARRAVAFPYGPSFVSPEWRDAEAALPRLVSVVVTRRAPGGLLIPVMALVDRTCLGIKNSLIGPPMSAARLDEFIEHLAERHGGMEPCEVLLAQSIVYHALDYARSLGFEPHPDFHEALFGPRPDGLLATPLATPARPFYISGPYDDVARILQQLRSKVGSDFEQGMAVGAGWPEDQGDDLDDDDEEEDGSGEGEQGTR